VYFNAFEDPNISDPGRWLANGRLSWDADGGRYSVGIWGKNIFAKKYAAAVYDLTGLGFYGSNRGAPRTYGADLTFKF
jgi:iron complex outermembrane receptor protein